MVIRLLMTYPPSLSLETGEAQIGGFSFSDEIQQASSSLRRSSRFVDSSRPRLPRQRPVTAVPEANRILRLSAYFIPFKDAATGNFRPGTTFDQIIDLYKFDVDLRRLVLEAWTRLRSASAPSLRTK